MEQYQYEFCGVSVQITAPYSVQEDAQAALFRRELQAESQLRIFLEPRDDLPEPEGQFCGCVGEKKTWRSGRSIIRYTQDLFRQFPHIGVTYDLTQPSDVRAVVRRQDWDWSTGSKYLWTGAALNQLLIHFRTLFFHASYVAYQGSGILFTAPSQTGKSTQAELWRKYRGAQVVNGDKAAVSLRGCPMVHGIPFSGTSGICGNVSLPLKAVVVLSQAPVSTIRQMGPTEAVAAICQNVFADQTIPEEWTLVLNLMLDLAASVPIYALACTPDIRAVEMLERAMIPY